MTNNLTINIVAVILIFAFSSLIVVNPSVSLILIFITLGSVILLYRIQGIKFWQLLMFASLLGYMTLNYGFSNYTLGFIKVPIGYLLIFTSLAISFFSNREYLKHFLRSPILILIFMIFTYSISHIIYDIYEYGIWAIRDASFIFELPIVLIGISMACNKSSRKLFFKFMFYIHIVILFYSFTYFFSEYVQSISPVSGVFTSVPLFGIYVTSRMFLVTGALYFLLVFPILYKDYAKCGIAISLIFLLLGLFFQARATYISILIGAFLYGRRKGFSKIILIAFVLLLIFAILLWSIQSSGMVSKGRVGEFSLDFYLSHILSLFLVESSEGYGSAALRVELAKSVIDNYILAGSRSFLFGSGFGFPLTDFYSPSNIIVRAPHNVHLSLMVRLGVLGYILCGAIVARTFFMVSKIMKCYKDNKEIYDLFLWVLFVLILFMLFFTFEPWLFFPHGSVPFYILLGFIDGEYYNLIINKNKAKEV